MWDNSWGARAEQTTATSGSPFDAEEELALKELAALDELERDRKNHDGMINDIFEDEEIGYSELEEEEEEEEEEEDLTTVSNDSLNDAEGYAETWEEEDNWWKDPLSMFDEDNEFDEDDAFMDNDEDVLEAAAEELASKQLQAKELALKQLQAEEGESARKATKKASIKPLKERLAFLKPNSRKSRKRRTKTARKVADHGKDSRMSAAGVGAGLASSIPALKTALTQGTLIAASAPVIKVFLIMGIGKVVYETVVSRSSEEEQDDEEGDAEYNAILMENPMHYSIEDPSRFSETDDESEYDNHVDSDIDSANDENCYRGKRSGGQAGLWGGVFSSLGGKKRQPIIQGAPISGGLLTRRVKVTAEELDFLKTQAEKAMLERQTMEQEYEKTSFQLQEAQSEVSQLASTTKYLKSQLRDYEEMMDRTIRNERRKAKAEIARIKSELERARIDEQESIRRKFVREMHKMQAEYEHDRDREAMMIRAGASNHDNSGETEFHCKEERKEQQYHEGDSELSQIGPSSRKPKRPKSPRKSPDTTMD